MTMKKILLTFLFICIGSLILVYSQGERLESLKIAYLTKQLQLTTEEAQKFWPVYNVYESEMKQMVREHREKNGSEIELEEKILALHKKHKPAFLKVISEDKFDKLMVAEKSWNEMLRKELQRRKDSSSSGKQRSPGQP